MEIDVIIKTSGLDEKDIHCLRQKALREASKLRTRYPDAEIFLVEDDRDQKPPRLEIREVKKKNEENL